MRPDASGRFGGRLVFCASSAPYRGVIVTFSDSQGKHWNASSSLFLPGLDECQIAQAANGSLMLIDRNCNWQHCRGMAPQSLPPGNPHRLVVSASDTGGETWSTPAYQPQLVTPTCQMGIISYRGPRDKHPALYFSGPHHETERVNGTILASDTSGATFSRSLTLGADDDGSMSFGYSSLACGLVNAADESDCAVVYRVAEDGRFGCVPANCGHALAPTQPCLLNRTGIRLKRFKSWHVV